MDECTHAYRPAGGDKPSHIPGCAAISSENSPRVSSSKSSSSFSSNSAMWEAVNGMAYSQLMSESQVFALPHCVHHRGTKATVTKGARHSWSSRFPPKTSHCGKKANLDRWHTMGDGERGGNPGLDMR